MPCAVMAPASRHPVELVAARGLIGWPAMASIVVVCAFHARFRIEWIQGPSRRR